MSRGCISQIRRTLLLLPKARNGHLDTKTPNRDLDLGNFAVG